MEKADHLTTLQGESARLIDAIAEAPDGPIAHCGDWTNRSLGAHIGLVWSFAARNVEASDAAQAARVGDERKPPGNPDGLIDWLTGRRDALVAELEAANPDAPAWSFAPDNHTAGFWQRRMASETVIHRVDAQIGAGLTPDPIAPRVAADAIDEYTVVGLRFSSSRPDRAYPPNSLHIHCSDIEGEWMLVGNGAEVIVTREHGKGDAAVRGAAQSVLSWIWNRPLGEVEIFGDEGVAAAWQTLAP